MVQKCMLLCLHICIMCSIIHICHVQVCAHCMLHICVCIQNKCAFDINAYYMQIHRCTICIIHTCIYLCIYMYMLWVHIYLLYVVDIVYGCFSYMYICVLEYIHTWMPIITVPICVDMSVSIYYICIDVCLYLYLLWVFYIIFYYMYFILYVYYNNFLKIFFPFKS